MIRKSTTPGRTKSDEWSHTFGLVGIQRKEREVRNPVACNDAVRLAKCKNQEYVEQLRTFQCNISSWSNVQVTLNFEENAQHAFLIFLHKTSCRKLDSCVLYVFIMNISDKNRNPLFICRIWLEPASKGGHFRKPETIARTDNFIWRCNVTVKP